MLLIHLANLIATNLIPVFCNLQYRIWLRLANLKLKFRMLIDLLQPNGLSRSGSLEQAVFL